MRALWSFSLVTRAAGCVFATVRVVFSEFEAEMLPSQTFVDAAVCSFSAFPSVFNLKVF